MVATSTNSCSSCAIRGFDDFFAITGYYNTLYETSILDASTGASRIKFNFDFLSSAYAHHKMDSIYAVKTSTDVYRIALMGWPLFPNSYAYSVFYLEISATGILDEANSQ